MEVAGGGRERRMLAFFNKKMWVNVRLLLGMKVENWGSLPAVEKESQDKIALVIRERSPA